MVPTRERSYYDDYFEKIAKKNSKKAFRIQINILVFNNGVFDYIKQKCDQYLKKSTSMAIFVK